MKILITGPNGLCGSAIKEEVLKQNVSSSGNHLIQTSNHDFFFCGREFSDLTKANEVEFLFDSINPDYVIHTAARVGGIGGNEAMHEEFFYDNLSINLNIIRNCVTHHVKKLFAFSSVCVFPDSLEILEEDKMHTGPVFESNFAYGYAKRMVDVHIRAAEKQYKVKNWVSFIPGNIFGKHDMFSIQYGHIIPSLMHKLYIAKRDGSSFNVWGDGQSYREFIYVNDLARVILTLIEKDNLPNKIIVSGRNEYKIEDIVNILVETSDFKGEVKYDTEKPNGQRRRPSSKTVIDSLLPDFEYTNIRTGLQDTWQWFIDNYPNVRSEY
jgi:GDP-L-fucose synthase